MYNMIIQKNSHWAGHVARMDNTRLPKQSLFSQLPSGDRNRGSPQAKIQGYRYMAPSRKEHKRGGLVQVGRGPLIMEKNGPHFQQSVLIGYDGLLGELVCPSVIDIYPRYLYLLQHIFGVSFWEHIESCRHMAHGGSYQCFDNLMTSLYPPNSRLTDFNTE